MQEPLFDIFGTQHRETAISCRQTADNLKGGENNLVDLKTGGTKGIQKKALVDVKNRLALAPVTDNKAGGFKPSTRSTPALSKAKTTSFESFALKSVVGKKEPSKSDSSVPLIFVEETCKALEDYEPPEIVSDMGTIPFEEDDYEDLMPKSESYSTEQIHKLVNFWALTRPPSNSSSPPNGPTLLDVPTPDVQVPELSMLTIGNKLQPVPLPSFQIWEDDME